MMTYPLYEPPEHLKGSERHSWSLNEANQYRDWLLAELPDRIAYLIDFLGVPRRKDPNRHLLDIGKKAFGVLFDEPFSTRTPEGRDLAPEGFALAADMGLLMASYLLERYPDQLKWVIARTAKKDLSYNLPVLKGFPYGQLDPVGGSISEAHGILRGNKSYDIWQESLRYWSEQAERAIAEKQGS